MIKDDITFTNINIPKAINTHNTELQPIKIHICKTKHITVANTYFPLRDTASPHYNTVDKDIAYCIRHVSNIPYSILTGDVNAHTTLWYSHTDDHRGQPLLLVVSLHQSDPLSDTFFCDIVVNHVIVKRACLSQQRALEEMLHRLISFITITRGVILICIFPLS